MDQYVVPFGPHANCTLALCPLRMSVYGYLPSLAANVTFIVLYALAMVVHTYLGIRSKAYFFMACMLAGTLSAIIGYAGRVMMHSNPFNFAAFMMQIICVTTGPVYYCAAIYVTLAAIINYFSPSLSRFKPSLLYYIFIPCDLVSLVLQGGGGALSVASTGTSGQGVDLALAGLSFQLFTLVAFCALFADYMIRYLSSKTAQHRGPMKALGARLEVFFAFLTLAILLILTRCAYRLAELHAGYRGGLIKDEGLFIGLEGVVILTSVYCLMIGHPGLIFSQNLKDQSERITTTASETNNTVEVSKSTSRPPSDEESRPHTGRRDTK